MKRYFCPHCLKPTLIPEWCPKHGNYHTQNMAGTKKIHPTVKATMHSRVEKLLLLKSARAARGKRR